MQLHVLQEGLGQGVGAVAHRWVRSALIHHRKRRRIAQGVLMLSSAAMRRTHPLTSTEVSRFRFKHQVPRKFDCRHLTGDSGSPRTSPDCPQCFSLAQNTKAPHGRPPPTEQQRLMSGTGGSSQTGDLAASRGKNQERSGSRNVNELHRALQSEDFFGPLKVPRGKRTR